MVTRSASASHAAEEQGQWVVADGLQPLGLATAGWLAARHGRRHLVLLDSVGRCEGLDAFCPRVLTRFCTGIYALHTASRCTACGCHGIFLHSIQRPCRCMLLAG